MALDADAAGQQQWRTLARAAALRGKRGAGLPAGACGSLKDANEARVAGVLRLGGWPAVGDSPEILEVPADFREIWEECTSLMVYDGHLPRAAAERLVWAGLQPQRDPR